MVKGPFMLPLRLLAALAIAPFGVFVQNDRALPPTHENIPVVLRIDRVEVEAKVPPHTRTVGDALVNLAIDTENAFLAPPAESPLSPNLSITVLHLIPLIVRDGTEGPRTMHSFGPTVGDVLSEHGVVLNSLDRIEPPTTTLMYRGLSVSVTRISEEEETERIVLPFTVRYQNDPDLSWGRERLIHVGRNGRADELVRVRTENGRVTKRIVLSRDVVENPSDEIRARGTKISIGRTIEGQASWYAFKNGGFAASTMFPRGSWLRVTNLLNNKQVVVRVNDYGPTLPGRVIDLDAVAFKKLWPLWRGVFPSRVEEIL